MKNPGKLPPLPALRSFEAAARLGSVSAAAIELHVTHSAVSQQIKSLENSLGVKVFGRSGRRVILTAAGQELALGVNEALNTIAKTTKLVRLRANPNRLTITTLPSFAARWLAPRIDRFLAKNPGVELNIISTSTLLDYTRDGIDVGVRYGSGPYEGLDAIPFMRDEMLVVASPGYLASRNVREPADLSRCTLLRSNENSWASWFARVGLDWSEPDSGLFFFDFALALTWAENGHGVALTRRSLADDALTKGTLVQIFDVTLPDDRIYWFVTTKGIELTPLLDKFRTWMFSEAQAMKFDQ